MADPRTVERIAGRYALCISRCGSIAVVEDGRFVSLEPDPSHPTGQPFLRQGREAPELAYHPDPPAPSAEEDTVEGRSRPGLCSWGRGLATRP